MFFRIQDPAKLDSREQLLEFKKSNSIHRGFLHMQQRYRIQADFNGQNPNDIFSCECLVSFVSLKLAKNAKNGYILYHEY